MRLLISFLAGLLLFSACQDPTEGIVVHISPDFYDYAVNLQLRDLSQPNLALNQSPDFTISGEAALGVYTIDGTRNFRFNNGETALILNRLTHAPSANQPLRFRLQIEARGYRPKSFFVQIDEGEFYSEEIIYLLPEDPNMNGIEAQRSASTLSNNNLAESLALSFATSSDTLPASFNLDLDSGVSFIDRAGQVVTGSNFELDVVGFDTYSDNSTLSLPGSSLVQFVEINGQPTQSFIGPMPRLDLQLSVDGKEVKGLRGGKMHTRMNIPETTNPLTLETYAEGDSIDVISYDEQDQYWKFIGTEVVQKDSAGKFVTVDLDDFSAKSFTKIASNQANVHVQVRTTGHLMMYNDLRVEFNGGDGAYAKLINRTGNTNFDIKLDPAMIAFARFNPNVVYLEAVTGSGLFSSRNPVGSGKGIRVNWNSTSDTVRFSLDQTSDVFVGYYRAFCVNQPNVLLYPPVGTRVFIKEAGSAEYGLSPVHIVTRENKNQLRFETAAVEDGKTYDIKIRYNGKDVAERLGVPAVFGDTIPVEIPAADCSALGI